MNCPKHICGLCEATDRDGIGSPSVQGCHLVTLYYVNLQFIIPITICVQTNECILNIILASIGYIKVRNFNLLP